MATLTLTQEQALEVLRRRPPRARRGADLLWAAWGGFIVSRAVADLVRGEREAYVAVALLVGLGLLGLGLAAWFEVLPRRRRLRGVPLDQVVPVTYQQLVPSGKRILRDEDGRVWLPGHLPRGVSFGDQLWVTPLEDGHPFAAVVPDGTRAAVVPVVRRWDDAPLR
ncbi:hypothetical protein [Arsenicicoccus dermatophilus]|uniref:hypothetical protein n=1 Tax=Arsenicicoccus dermatophilus TaxID=1076331 RepID=UPI001F4C7407|nr:hypothetical protein [Arsenicicoccus dermatophilus]MCH8612697.1 hypothetical protein [Arsenicicoccus dermatophilus]